MRKPVVIQHNTDTHDNSAAQALPTVDAIQGYGGGKKTDLLVITYVVSERDEASFELLRLKFVVPRLVEVHERLAELLNQLVADTLRVTRQHLSTTSSISRRRDTLPHSHSYTHTYTCTGWFSNSDFHVSLH